MSLPPSDSSKSSSKGLDRRQFMQVGFLGGLGLGLPEFCRLKALGGIAREARADSVIHIFLPGGMAHQESFDPKRFAPIEYRGPYRAVETSVKGEYFSELFKRTAKVAHELTVCRSVHHGEAAHERGTHNMFTGYRPSPALQYPSMGSVVSHELGSRSHLPAYVSVPNQPNIYAGSGFLSSAYGPFSLGSDPARDNFAVRDLRLPKGVEAERFERRKELLELVDDHFRELESSDDLDAMDAFYQRAYAMISSKEAREAFDLQAEPEELRKRYGQNAAGSRLLLARRLVEAGVRFVSVVYGGWDHHDRIKDSMRRNAPALDKAFAALIGDLKQRGRLDKTLVMLTTEFGRTPRINRTEGRDHWPRVFSVVLAGGGIKRGLFHGASDTLGAEPERDPVTIENLAATVYGLIGIDFQRELIAPGDRPIEIVKGGRMMEEILA